MNLALPPFINFYSEIIWPMEEALQMANKGFRENEVPVGCVITNDLGNILVKSHNLKEKNHNACHHAEILALEELAMQEKNWRLCEKRVFVTLEPCPMCLAAMVHFRVALVVFGAYDPKGGAISLGYHLYKDKRLNHRFPVMGGILEYSCSKLLSEFFKQKRSFYEK